MHDSQKWFTNIFFLDSNKTNEKKFEKDLSKRFENIYQLCDGGIDKFCLMLQKGVSR